MGVCWNLDQEVIKRIEKAINKSDDRLFLEDLSNRLQNVPKVFGVSNYDSLRLLEIVKKNNL